MSVLQEMAQTVGVAEACRSLSVSRAAFYRKQRIRGTRNLDRKSNYLNLRSSSSGS